MARALGRADSNRPLVVPERFREVNHGIFPTGFTQKSIVEGSLGVAAKGCYISSCAPNRLLVGALAPAQPFSDSGATHEDLIRERLRYNPGLGTSHQGARMILVFYKIGYLVLFIIFYEILQFV